MSDALINLVGWVISSGGKVEITPHVSGIRLHLSTRHSHTFREGMDIGWMVTDCIKNIQNINNQVGALEKEIAEDERNLKEAEDNFSFRQRKLQASKKVLAELQQKVIKGNK